MIIGINGKIGSGKDTVGRVIQYLKCHNVGNITLEDVISSSDHDWWIEEQSKWEIKKFAGKLKQTASLLTGIDVEKFEDQEFKKQQMSAEWGMTYREFLQKLGTDAMRDGLHTNVWMNALFADYRNFHTDKFSVRQGINEPEYPNWIITDMRFPNEMDAVKEREGITIRVVRQYSKEDLCKGSSPYIRDEELSAKLAKRYQTMADLPVVKLHSSETALDDATFDYEIINDGSIEDLIEKVKQILIEQKII